MGPWLPLVATAPGAAVLLLARVPEAGVQICAAAAPVVGPSYSLELKGRSGPCLPAVSVILKRGLAGGEPRSPPGSSSVATTSDSA